MPPAGAQLDGGERLLAPSSFNASPARIRELSVTVDGVVAGRLQPEIAIGECHEAVQVEPRAILNESRPRTPVEELVLRSMTLAAAQQRHLLDLSARVPSPKVKIRYAELALCAVREVIRVAAVVNELRRPPTIRVGPGAGQRG